MIELQQKYLEISKDIISVLDDMKSNWDRYPDYLGWFDLNGPIIEHPDILFIGINQGLRKISAMELGQLGRKAENAY